MKELNTYCFIDTETTSFFRTGNRIQEGQARVCQLAMILTDSVGKPLAKFSSLIKPDGWKIGEGAFKVHGITDEMCIAYGISFKTAIGFYNFMAQKANYFVAHNADFDKNMMEIECSYKLGEDVNAAAEYLCTMKPNTDVVKAPKKNGTGYKWPNLEETLQFFCGRSMGDTAHDALADTEACKDIFFAMQARKAANG